MASARSLTAPAGSREASAMHASRTTSCSAAVLVPTRSQVFRSLAFVLAESVEGACTMRLQASTRCWGVSWLAAPLWPLLAAGFVLDLDLLLLPHPTRSAPLRSATTRRVDSFRNDDPLLRGT